MSRQLVFKKIMTAVFVFLVVTLGFFISRHHEDGSLEISSHGPIDGHIASHKTFLPHSDAMGKHLALLQSQLRAAEIPEDDRDEATLEAFITLTQPVDGALTYKLIWDRDSGIESEDEVLGYLNASVGQQQKVIFKLKRFSRSERKIVTLLVEAQKDGHVYGSTSLVSSRPEDSMEYIAPSKMESALKFHEEQKSPREVSSTEK